MYRIIAVTIASYIILYYSDSIANIPTDNIAVAVTVATVGSNYNSS